MALAGLDAIRALHQLEARNARITQAYLRRHRALEQIRSCFYLSSTVVRDFLLDRNPQAAQASLTSLRGIEMQMEVAVREYAAAIRPEEQALLSEIAERRERLLEHAHACHALDSRAEKGRGLHVSGEGGASTPEIDPRHRGADRRNQ